MQRWQVTLALSALAALVLARGPLLARTAAPTPPAIPADPLIPELGADLRWDDPLPSAAGPLVLDAGFDRPAVLATARDEIRYLSVALTAPGAGSGPRPVDLAVVLDVSCSMAVGGKLDQAARAVAALAARLGAEDALSLTVYSDDATLILPDGPVDHPDRVRLALATLAPGGGTNLYAGLERGARELRGADPRRNRRLLLLSDGRANVGVTDGGTIRRLAADLQADGITLSTVGLGADFDEDLVQALADIGGGAYTFADPQTDVSEVFTSELAAARATEVRGATVDVVLPANVRLVDVLGWDEVIRPDGCSVFVGDVAAGQRRKLVVAVRVDGRVAAEPVLVRASYTDAGAPDAQLASGVVRAPAGRTR